MRKRLFAVPFGPTYYRGFVDAQGSELVPVAFTATSNAAADRWVTEASDQGSTGSTTPGWIVTSLGVASVATAAVFTGPAIDAKSKFDATQLERPAAEAQQQFDSYRNLAIGFGVGGLVAVGAGVFMLMSAR